MEFSSIALYATVDTFVDTFFEAPTRGMSSGIFPTIALYATVDTFFEAPIRGFKILTPDS